MSGGTNLRKFTTTCGTTLYLPDHGYHMPKADIRLDYPQYFIRELGGSGHDVIDVGNVDTNVTFFIFI